MPPSPQGEGCAGNDARPGTLPGGAGERVIQAQGLGVGHDLPARPAAAVGAGTSGAGKGPEAGRGQVLHGFAMCLSICTHISISSTGMYS